MYDQQIALGSLPDVGVRRAFANRDVPGPEGKRYFIKVPAFDFFVRVPQGHISASTLSRLNVILHNVDDAPDRLTTLTPFAKQASVKTIERHSLDKSVSEVGQVDKRDVRAVVSEMSRTTERAISQSRSLTWLFRLAQNMLQLRSYCRRR